MKKKYQDKMQISMAKRRNAKVFPIYKMFSWDLLFYYSIQFLFFTLTKGISAADVLKISAIEPICNILWQVPAIIMSDWLGRKKSIIIGNVIIAIHFISIIFIPGAWGIILGTIIFSFGYSLKSMQESNLLYDSVATKGGDGLFSRLNEKGGKGYYVLDGIASLLAGYLFVQNNYLPMYISLAFVFISIGISFQFKDIYGKNVEGNTLKEEIKEYKQDFKESIKAIAKSKRLRSLIIFASIFLSLITIEDTYRETLLVELSVNPEMFSIIFAILTLIGGISVGAQSYIHKKWKNRSLRNLSLIYVASIILIGVIMSVVTQTQFTMIIPIILFLYATQYIIHSNYYLLEDHYLKNFTTPQNRGRVSFAHGLFSNITIAVTSFLAGTLLEWVSISHAFLLIGLVFLAIIVVTLDYMRKHFGLSPEEYSENDINF